MGIIHIPVNTSDIFLGFELIWAYVQFRGSEFHTRNARFRQPQEQRRAKAQR